MNIKLLPISLAVTAALLSGPQLALGGTINWDGDNSVGNMSFNNNWYGNGSSDANPNNFGGFVFTNDLQFNFNNGAATSIFNDYGSFKNINDIFFMNTFNGVNGAISLEGSDGSGLNFNQRFENQSTATVTLGSTGRLSGGKNGATQIELNPVGGNMVINGSIFNDNSRGYRVYGATGKTLTLNSALGVGSSAGSVSFTIDATSTTKVVNTAAQTWTGSTNINNGSFTLGNGGTAGTLDTGSLIILGSSGSLIINRSNAVNQGTDFSGSAVSGSGSLTQAGSGTTTLSAANTYTGGTIVNGSGTLLVNGGAVGTSSGTGTGAVTVSNTAALGGTGAISGTVAVSATSKITGGGLGTSAADALASVGTLNTGALTLASGSIFLVDIGTTTSFDKLGITGTANLGSATLSLNIATGLTFTPNQQLILIENDSADSFTGTFAGLAEGGTITSGGYTFTASYLGGTGNDFALTAVPEPSTWIGGGLILGLAAYSQRRRFRANDLSAGKRDHRDMFPQIN